METIGAVLFIAGATAIFWGFVRWQFGGGKRRKRAIANKPEIPAFEDLDIPPSCYASADLLRAKPGSANAAGVQWLSHC